jgi:hypothetical protein
MANGRSEDLLYTQGKMTLMPTQMKVGGERRDGIAGSPENADSWLKTIQELRGNQGVCPPGVYRFRTFE